ncbi:MAG: hypothetical protein AAF830_17415 [Pseudomonadota bacterium]
MPVEDATNFGHLYRSARNHVADNDVELIGSSRYGELYGATKWGSGRLRLTLNHVRIWAHDKAVWVKNKLTRHHVDPAPARFLPSEHGISKRLAAEKIADAVKADLGDEFMLSFKQEFAGVYKHLEPVTKGKLEEMRQFVDPRTRCQYDLEKRLKSLSEFDHSLKETADAMHEVLLVYGAASIDLNLLSDDQIKSLVAIRDRAVSAHHSLAADGARLMQDERTRQQVQETKQALQTALRAVCESVKTEQDVASISAEHADMNPVRDLYHGEWFASEPNRE